ncbi:MAG: hypothetical protein ACHQ4H_16270, partial [Ktedonobacterales bacterium]
MLCWRCKRPVREDARACVHCGASLTEQRDDTWDDSYEQPARGQRGSRPARYGNRPPTDDDDDARGNRRPAGRQRSRGRGNPPDGLPDPLDDPRAPGVLRQPRAPGRGSPPPQRDAPRGGSRSGSRTDDRGYPPGRS